jgi:hypothetical protein
VADRVEHASRAGRRRHFIGEARASRQNASFVRSRSVALPDIDLLWRGTQHRSLISDVPRIKKTHTMNGDARDQERSRPRVNVTSACALRAVGVRVATHFSHPGRGCLHWPASPAARYFVVFRYRYRSLSWIAAWSYRVETLLQLVHALHESVEIGVGRVGAA